ncbi:hypothetical protein JY97_14975 [Alkalispirochaeta odontotermitis]|nr:hypothetical protein JY97_14975 [Alkalispirochaeta odontotermitis]
MLITVGSVLCALAVRGILIPTQFLAGVGSGITLKFLGSAGGLDILTVILFKKYSIRPERQ